MPTSIGFASVRVLTNKRGDKDKKDAPTTANIRAALTELLAKRKKHDTVLVFDGRLVATRLVPEPAGGALLVALGAAGTLRRRRSV